ncbi:MAG: TldD/PmbA family protein [Pseudomonadota bacterium]
MKNRRDFLRNSALMASGVCLPVGWTAISAQTIKVREPITQQKKLAEIALNYGKSRGVSYMDVRIDRTYCQKISVTNANLHNALNSMASGIGIRVLYQGVWGFAATHRLTSQAISKTVDAALINAKTFQSIQTNSVKLNTLGAPNSFHWKTPIKINGFDISIQDKLDLLREVNAVALSQKASHVVAHLALVNQKKYFASSENRFIEQDLYKIACPFVIRHFSERTRREAVRSSLGSAMSMGYEYLIPRQQDKKQGIVTRYGFSYDVIEDAKQASAEAQRCAQAPKVTPGQYDILLDPSVIASVMPNTVVKSHPSNDDSRMGSESMYVMADRVQPGGLASVKYDDEGVPSQRWPWIQAGIKQAELTSREKSDEREMLSKGCSFADDWASPQKLSIPNLSLTPHLGDAFSPLDMIKNVEKGLYLIGRKPLTHNKNSSTMSIGSELCFEIKAGKIQGIVSDVMIKVPKKQFWQYYAMSCDKKDYQLVGQTNEDIMHSQTLSGISLGSATSRFNGLSVMNAIIA